MATTKTIDLKTAIPGPRSQEILARKERVIAQPLSIVLPVVIDHGEGATLTDVDGNTFIDFSGGGRLPERRPRQPAGGRSGSGTGGEVLPHRLHDRPVRALRHAGGAARRDRADARPGEGG